MALLDAAGLAEVRSRFESWASASHLELPGTPTNIQNVVLLADQSAEVADTSLGTGGTTNENTYIQNNPAIARQLKVFAEQVRRDTL